MKIFFIVVSLTVLSCIQCLAAKFEIIQTSQLKSSSLKKNAPLIKAVQDKSKSNSNGESKLDIKSVQITLTPNQSKIDMLRQLMHIDFNCSTGAAVSVTAIDVKTEIANATLAFTNYESENPYYILEMVNYLNSLQNTINVEPNLELYKIMYGGEGSCEYGIRGFLILDTITNEALMARSHWST